MKTNFIKRLLGVVLTCVAVFMINGCKKMDSEKVLSTLSQETRKKAQEMVDNNPQLQNVTYNLNIEGAGHYADANGNRIDPKTDNSFTYHCPDVNNGETFDFDIAPVLETITREWSCSQGYRFKMKWKISVPLNISAVNPNTSQLTRGRFRMRNTSGTLIYEQNNIPATSIISLGDDPTTFNINKVWYVEYSTNWIAFSYFTMNTAPLEHYVWAQTDCADVPQRVNSATSPALISVLNACDRIEQIGITNAEISGGTYITNGTLLGYYALVNPCTPPSGSTMPDRHEVQLRCVEPLYYETAFRKITPQWGIWPGTPVTLNGYLDPFNGTIQANTIGLIDAYYIRDYDITVAGTIRHGAYKVRYRNVKTGNCNGPWSQEYDAYF